MSVCSYQYLLLKVNIGKSTRKYFLLSKIQEGAMAFRCLCWPPAFCFDFTSANQQKALLAQSITREQQPAAELPQLSANAGCLISEEQFDKHKQSGEPWWNKPNISHAAGSSVCSECSFGSVGPKRGFGRLGGHLWLVILQGTRGNVTAPRMAVGHWGDQCGCAFCSDRRGSARRYSLQSWGIFQLFNRLHL